MKKAKEAARHELLCVMLRRRRAGVRCATAHARRVEKRMARQARLYATLRARAKRRYARSALRKNQRARCAAPKARLRAVAPNQPCQPPKAAAAAAT